MAQKTDEELLIEASVIKNETAAGANTANRLGTMLEDIIDSKVNNSYKIYAALLTQNGGDDPLSNNNDNQEALTIGRTYFINTNDNLEADFTNVGAPNNNVGTYFVATGTTPASWGSVSDLLSNGGAPIVTVLKNTLGNVGWTFRLNGVYRMYINDFDISNAYISSYAGYNSNTELSYTFAVDPSYLNAHEADFFSHNVTDNTNDNSILIKTPIEIRIYN